MITGQPQGGRLCAVHAVGGEQAARAVGTLHLAHPSIPNNTDQLEQPLAPPGTYRAAWGLEALCQGPSRGHNHPAGYVANDASAALACAHTVAPTDHRVAPPPLLQLPLPSIARRNGGSRRRSGRAAPAAV